MVDLMPRACWQATASAAPMTLPTLLVCAQNRTVLRDPIAAPRLFKDEDAAPRLLSRTGSARTRIVRRTLALPAQRELQTRTCETLAPRQAPGYRAGRNRPFRLRRQTRARHAAPVASIRARWEKAWGKFPRCRPVLVSNSSA